MTDPTVRGRIDALAIPPAWQDVWITPFANGHLQVVGTDAAGRRQYLYHDAWHADRGRAKFDRALELGLALSRARVTVSEHLSRTQLDRDRVLATAFRLLDLGHFRIGSAAYADRYGSYGLSTLQQRPPAAHSRAPPVLLAPVSSRFKPATARISTGHGGMVTAPTCSGLHSAAGIATHIQWESSGTRQHQAPSGLPGLAD